MAEKVPGKTRAQRPASTTPEDYPSVSSSTYPSGDYTYTLEVVMGMQATLGKLTEAVNALKEQSKDHGKELKEIGKDVHAAKVAGKTLLWIVGIVGTLLGIILAAWFRKLFGAA
jgi:hypothetical protein